MTAVASHTRLRLLLGAGGVVLLALLAPSLAQVDAVIFDRLQRWRAEAQPADSAPYVLVEIDDPSIAALGRFPWSRSRFAELLAAVRAGDAKAVAMDVLFSESADSLGDARFADELRAAGNVVLASAPELAADRAGRGAPPSALRVLEPIPSLASAAAGVGSIAVLEDGDGSLRQYALEVNFEGRMYPSLVRVVARQAAGATELPAITGNMGINYGALSPAAILRIGFSDALKLTPDEARSLFGGRIVFVGANYSGGVDYGPTPLHERTPRVIAQVYATHTLLAGRPLRQLPPWTAFVISGVLVALLAMQIPARQPTQLLTMGAGLVILVLGAAIIAFYRRDVIVAASLPVLVTGFLISGYGLEQWWVSNAALRDRNRELAEALEHLRRTRADKEKLEAELSIAREIQFSMLPVTSAAALGRNEFTLEARLSPARTVGGDFYDYFMVDEHRLCVCVGDVSDKGVPAALFMAVARTILKSGTSRHISPGTTLTVGNVELIRDNPASMFVSAWLGLLDLRTGELVYSNAGHNRPYIRTATGTVVRLSEIHGPVLAAVTGTSYGEERIMLGAGDVLLLYTDGVTEAPNVRGELYEEGRLSAALAAGGHESPEQLVASLSGDVERFQEGAPQADDLTLLALRFVGPSATVTVAATATARA